MIQWIDFDYRSARQIYIYEISLTARVNQKRPRGLNHFRPSGSIFTFGHNSCFHMLLYVIGQKWLFSFKAKALSSLLLDLILSTVVSTFIVSTILPFRDFPVHLCSKHKIRLLNFGDNSLYPYLWWIISLTSCTSDNLII